MAISPRVKNCHTTDLKTTAYPEVISTKISHEFEFARSFKKFAWFLQTTMAGNFFRFFDLLQIFLFWRAFIKSVFMSNMPFHIGKNSWSPFFKPSSLLLPYPISVSIFFNPRSWVLCEGPFPINKGGGARTMVCHGRHPPPCTSQSPSIQLLWEREIKGKD